MRSYARSRLKLSSIHLLLSSFAAVAGVAIAVFQTLGSSSGTQPPVNVTVAVEPPAQRSASGATDMVVGKSDQAPGSVAIDLGQGTNFASALNDGAEQRYEFADLFDGRQDSFVTILPPDREINVLVTFKSATAEPVTAIEYSPPPGVASSRLATVLDVMVLPEGHVEASGRPVMSFTLQAAGAQTFALPGNAVGKGLWIRVAGANGAGDVAVGDFRVLKE